MLLAVVRVARGQRTRRLTAAGAVGIAHDVLGFREQLIGAVVGTRDGIAGAVAGTKKVALRGGATRGVVLERRYSVQAGRIFCNRTDVTVCGVVRVYGFETRAADRRTKHARQAAGRVVDIGRNAPERIGDVALKARSVIS